MAAKATFIKSKGCSYCNHTGYRGRVGLFEMMMITSKIRELIFKQESAPNIRKVAMSQGMGTLFHDGIIKIMEGTTTFDEVYRIAKRTEQDQFG
jgi:type IV pilus assembly protein PilB